MKSARYFILIALCSLIACTQQGEAPLDVAAWQQEVRNWRQQRLARLTSPTGWLSLRGLFWLKPGVNNFGAAADNDIVFPVESAPAYMGRMVLADGVVTLEARAGVEITIDGQPVRGATVISDTSSSPVVLEYESLSWFIIRRGEQHGVRLRDANHPAIAAFPGIDSYDLDPAWRIRARFQPYDPPKEVDIENVLGMVSREKVPGQLVFEKNGRMLHLDVLDSGDQYWIIFSDETSGESTYGAGRYLYVPKGDSLGHIYIDFNRAYNPPCAFTDFATCPLPPAQNHLDIAVAAGEKYGLRPEG